MSVVLTIVAILTLLYIGITIGAGFALWVQDFDEHTVEGGVWHYAIIGAFWPFVVKDIIVETRARREDKQ